MVIFQLLKDFIQSKLTAGSPSQQRHVGLDLGAASIKCVELHNHPAKGWQLAGSLVQELPATAEGKPSSQTDWLRTTLKAMEAREVHLSLHGPEVILRRMPMPLMPLNELREAVKWQLKEELTFPVEEAIIDCAVVGEVWEKDLRKHDVLVAAAPAAVVRAACEQVTQAGGHVVSVLPAAYATWAAVSSLLPQARKATTAIVDAGLSDTRVTIVKEGSVCLVRDLPTGSAQLSEALIGVVSGERGEITIDAQKAEAIKRRYGVLTETAEGATAEGIPLFQLAVLMRPVLEQLLTELSRLLSYYQTQMDEAGVAKILLCGGGANIKALAPFLAEGLGLTVEIFNPLVRIPDRLQLLEPEQIADTGTRLTVAVGAAIAQGKVLNLIPQQLQDLKAIEEWAKTFKRALQVSSAALAVFLAVLLFGLASARWQMARANKRWKTAEPGYARYMETAASRRQAESSLAIAQGFLDAQPVWDGVLKELSLIMPAPLVAEEITITPAASGAGWVFHLIGQGTTAAGSVHAGLSQLMDAMNHSAFFSDAEMVSSEMNNSGTGSTRIEIEGRLR